MRFVFAALVYLSLVGVAYAFGAVNFVGQGAEHRKITRLALKDFGFGTDTMDQLAGVDLSFGAVGSPDRPDRGLIDDHEAHCDDGDFIDVSGYPNSRRKAEHELNECRQHIFRFLKRAIRFAGKTVHRDGKVNVNQISGLVPCGFHGQTGRAKCNTLGAMGVAFHAGQDFYAHTNWVDVPALGETGPLNPPGLGNNDRADWLDPRQHASFPEGLISGCFQGLPEELGCTYGGGKDRVRHSVLNKDVGFIDVKTGKIGNGTSPRGKINGNFHRAVLAAISDTKDKWRYFEEQVLEKYGDVRGQIILCVIKSDDERACSE